MRTFVIAAIALGSLLSAAPATAQELLVDEETYSISQCGTGLLQTTCAVLNLRYRTVCTGQEFCLNGTIRFDPHIQVDLIAASDLPLGGNANYEVRSVVSGACPPSNLCEHAFHTGGCSWPLLASSCQTSSTLPRGFPWLRLHVIGNASSLLSNVVVDGTFTPVFDSQGQISFLP